MNHLVPGMALHLGPRRELSLKRSAVISPEPRAGRPPVAAHARRHSWLRVTAAWPTRRRWAGPSDPGGRPSARTGVSPVAGGATRGVAFLVDR